MPLTIERMFFVLALLLSFAHAEDGSIEIQRETPVYQKPSYEGRVLFNLHPGEKIATVPAKNPEFLHIRIERKGHSYQGFVARTDVGAASLGRARGDFAFGLGGMYTSLTQNSKTFETDDQVQYTTTDYHSSGMSPSLSVQYHDENFWRLSVANKKTHYTGSAKTNVSGSVAQSVDLQMNFWSVMLEKAWMPFENRNFYFGLGAEVARATSISIKLGDSVLTPSSSDIPTYAGALAFAGGTLSLSRSLSIYGEGRFEYIANQQPAIHGLEAAVGILYWP